MRFLGLFKKDKIKPLRLPGRKMTKRRDSGICMMERELKDEPKVFKELLKNVGDVSIDLNPTLIEDKYFIELKAQKIVLEFDVFKTRHWYQFQLCNSVHMSRYRDYVALRAEQILIPLMCLARIDIDEGILHYMRGSDFHLRIASRHMDSIWSLENGRLNIFGCSESDDQWIIEITDHKAWSTSY